MRVRTGISRTAAEVILLVVATALALLLLSPVGQMVMDSIHRAVVTSHVKYRLEIVAVDPRATVPDYPWVPASCRGGTALAVAIKNVGDEPIEEYRWEQDWALVLRNSTGSYTLAPCYLDCTGLPWDCSADPRLEPGEIWIVYVPSGVQDPDERFVVEIFGPEGSRAVRVYP